MTQGKKVTLAAPAKINLGLEVLGRRSDGFHDIRTVMAMVNLSDTLTVAIVGTSAASRVEGVKEENLIARALAAYRKQRPRSPMLGWSIEKRIPLAAGLGGASSDAAAMLRAANHLCPDPLDEHLLYELAADLGSDVPFFLNGPAAVASGRGTKLEVIELPRLDLLLVVPRVELRGKTQLLYSLLQSSDFTDGTRIDDLIHTIRTGRTPSRLMLRNAFGRALCSHVPRIQQLQDVLERDLDFPWGLSWAGPGHYVIAPIGEHDEIRRHLESRFPAWLETSSVTTLHAVPDLSVDTTGSG